MFAADSELRRVHRERAVQLHGPRALLMQAAHPVAFELLYRSSDALADPYARLARTAQVMDLIYFGAEADVKRETARVRAMHRRIGVDRPDLLLWVLASLADSAIVVHERYVGRLDRDAYWDDMRIVGRLFGLRPREMPSDLQEYVAGMLAGDVLRVTPRAREVAVEIVLRPPVPTLARPLLEIVNTAITGLLPVRLRRDFGLSWDPGREALTRLSAQHLRWGIVPLLPRQLRWTSIAQAA